ncbi:MAG TPA: hypothetical protein VEA92_02175 [Candidatus Paceibacterota bacterium]|nr:hypothetical protein [Candidatus Paceibacterota bacterium]
MWKKLLVFIFLVSGVVTWMQKDPFTQADKVRADELPDIVEPGRERFMGEGIVVRYQSNTTPIYYLLYETQGHRFVRKELRFTEERGCAPSAGDLPCVYPSGENTLPVPIGSHVRVSGVLDAQRILVESLEIVPDYDGDFAIGTVEVGQEFAANEVQAYVHEVYSGGACEVLLGCYREGIPRVRFTVRTDDDQREITMVPGMLEYIPDGAVLLLWGDEARGSATFVIAYGEAR